MGNYESQMQGDKPIAFVLRPERNKFAHLLDVNSNFEAEAYHSRTTSASQIGGDVQHHPLSETTQLDFSSWTTLGLAYGSLQANVMRRSDKLIWNDPLEYAKAKDWLLLYFASIKNTRHVKLVAHGLTKLFPEISVLHLQCVSMQLQYNYLESLPAEIGALVHLRHLNLSQNKLSQLPDEIGLLSSLIELRCSYNRLKELPKTIGQLAELRVLHVDSNDLRSVAPEIQYCTHLSVINLSHNVKLRYLPAEIARLKELKRLEHFGCQFGFEPDFIDGDMELMLNGDVPTLKETVARMIVRNRVPLERERLPQHLAHYIDGASKCSFCKGPLFSHVVYRKQLLERSDGQLPLVHRLCCKHWSTEKERIATLFAPLPWTAPVVAPLRPSPTIVRQPQQPQASQTVIQSEGDAREKSSENQPVGPLSVKTNSLTCIFQQSSGDSPRTPKTPSTVRSQRKSVNHSVSERRTLEEEHLAFIRKNALLIS